jgi:hypothetical protein
MPLPSHQVTLALSPAITPSNWQHERTEWPADPSEGDEAGEASLYTDSGHEDIHLVIDILIEPGSPEKFRSVSIPSYARKGIAALALHDMAFGFTHEEREAINACVAASATGEIVSSETRTLAATAANKIFSLLKPKTAISAVR